MASRKRARAYDIPSPSTSAPLSEKNRTGCPELPNLSPYAIELIPRTGYYHAQLARIGSPKVNYNYGAVP